MYTTHYLHSITHIRKQGCIPPIEHHTREKRHYAYLDTGRREVKLLASYVQSSLLLRFLWDFRLKVTECPIISDSPRSGELVTLEVG